MLCAINTSRRRKQHREPGPRGLRNPEFVQSGFRRPEAVYLTTSLGNESSDLVTNRTEPTCRTLVNPYITKTLTPPNVRHHWSFTLDVQWTPHGTPLNAQNVPWKTGDVKFWTRGVEWNVAWDVPSLRPMRRLERASWTS